MKPSEKLKEALDGVLEVSLPEFFNEYLEMEKMWNEYQGKIVKTLAWWFKRAEERNEK